MQTSIATFFSSSAKTRILKVLSEQTSPLHLRLIADLAECNVHSVERVLEDLLSEKLIKKQKIQNRVFFALRREKPIVESLCEVLKTITQVEMRNRAKTYSKRAQGALAFAEEFRDLYPSVK